MAATTVKAVSLDFDDTLIWSEATKRRVLVEVASRVAGGEAGLDAVETDARKVGVKVTRQTIFRDLGKVLKVDDAEAFGRAKAEEFSREVDVALATCDEVPGATAMLTELAARGVPTFINSATPQKALEAAVSRRGWNVSGVFGSPDTGGDKVANLEKIRERLGVAHSEIVHVGDGENDAEAAKRFGCIFLGIRQKNRLFKDASLSVVEDMRAAARFLRPLFPPCRICDKNWDDDKSLVIWENETWLLCHTSRPAPIAGWCLLHTKRHAASPADFDAHEASTFGPLLRHLQIELLKATGAERIYCCAMAETSPHFHMHLVPRHKDQQTTGFALFTLQAAAKKDPMLAVKHDQVDTIVNLLRRSLSLLPP